MSYSSFMKFNDTITSGESLDAHYQGSMGWIEISSFSWAVNNSANIAAGSGAAAGRAAFSSFTVTKRFDVASPSLFLQCCLGKHFSGAQVVLAKAGGNQLPLEFINFTFKEVFVENLAWNGAAHNGDDTPVEVLSFAFGSVQVSYTEQSITGAAGQTPAAGWDIRQKVPLGQQ